MTSPLFAQPQTGAIAGTVQSKNGKSIQGATVMASPLAGGRSRSAITNREGVFRVESLIPGKYRVAVQCPECGGGLARQIAIEGNKTANIHFVVDASSTGAKAATDLLGPVRFKSGSSYQAGQLTDLSGGGGYSSSASMEANTMVRQYMQNASSRKGGPAGHGEISSQGDRAALERQGQELLAQQKYRAGIVFFEKATARYPASTRLREGLGLSQYGAGKYSAAVQSLIRAERLAPDDPGLIVLLGEAAGFAPGPQADAALQHFVARHPHSERGHFALGLYAWKTYKTSRNAASLATAQKQFENAVALRPDDSLAHLRLGIVYDAEGLTRAAASEYEKTIRIRPQLAMAHYRLAQDYQRLKEKQQAAQEFTRYEQLQNSNHH